METQENLKAGAHSLGRFWGCFQRCCSKMTHERTIVYPICWLRLFEKGFGTAWEWTPSRHQLCRHLLQRKPKLRSRKKRKQRLLLSGLVVQHYICIYIYMYIYNYIYIDCPIARCTPDLNSWNIFYLKTVFPTIYFTMEYSFPFRLHSLWSGNGRRSRPTKRTGSHSLGWFWVCFQGFFSPSIKSGWVCSLEDPLQFN